MKPHLLALGMRYPPYSARRRRRPYLYFLAWLALSLGVSTFFFISCLKG